MPVKHSSRPAFRHPLLAPVYAAVLAFGTVSLAAWVLPSHPTGTVTVEGAPDGVRLEIVDDGSVLASGELGDDDSWTPEVAVAGNQICVRTTAALRVVGSNPPSTCTGRQPAEAGSGEVKVDVERVKVHVAAAAGVQGRPSAELTVDNDDDIHLNDDGDYFPPTPLAGRTVCVEPRDGWEVGPLPGLPGAPRCTSPNNPAADVVFTLVRSKP
ncbi:hypothetical protein [Pseudonocardia sp. TRM90224]|uniref:hypothetical protein n=1 Tax=Pseudonocardia sp. TRM90224 TaxID=2812678 RepID=UPI001E2E0B12|nr:hypothetical protein [Pseudonocardia sp. TRM90224]